MSDELDSRPDTKGLGARLARRSSRPPKRFVAISVALHAAVVAALVLAGMTLGPKLPEFEQFRVTLVSPPAQVEAPAPEPVETTTPVVSEPEPTPPEPTPQPRPEPPKTQAPAPQPVERRPDPKPARGPDPKPVPVGGENLNIVQEGREFLFPEYSENIVIQLNRFFRWNGDPGPEAQVSFSIMRDGSVRDIRIVRRSGVFAFDIEAQGAVEQAGNRRVFGALPAEWQGDRLQVLYTFEKPR
ncbi:MAG TPA: TonB C-terminal domain-containing protein [Longimicrobiales bacterium]|nr:TonB C-terminal domain-containing protein [Longimicrobiales bacterium]